MANTCLNSSSTASLQPENCYLAAVPRSGSTWLAKRLEQLYGLDLYEEPLRRLCGDMRSKLYHATCLHEQDADLLEANDIPVDACERDRVLDHFRFMNTRRNTLTKETVGLMQLSYLRRMLRDTYFVFLRRHLCGSLHSHMNIPNYWNRWHYEARIHIIRLALQDTVTKCSSQVDRAANDAVAAIMTDRIRRYQEYLQICSRADDYVVFGDKRCSRLLAHLAIQSLEGAQHVDTVLQYEDMCDDGIPADVLPFPVQTDVEDLDAPEHREKYETHGTKNATSPHKWIEHMDERSWGSIQRILGERHEELCPRFARNKTCRAVEVPSLSFIPVGSGAQISNRVVMTGDFAEFLNACLDAGIQDVLEKLGMQESEHSVQDTTSGHLERRFTAQNATKPMILATPTACMAYAAFRGYRLPSKAIYDTLHQQYGNALETLTTEHANFAEDQAKMTPVGYTKPLHGFYDIFGNQKEFCLDEHGTILAIGGSYSDEKSELQLDRCLQYAHAMRDERTSFRLQAIEGAQPDVQECKNGVLQLINTCRTTREIFEGLMAQYTDANNHPA
ncbi:MAG: hypothetical protein PHU04_05305 [Candidatus Peribacteraceae bacterium]|nr:hypothetical protein [Candidatus Peribacteraceae bacterium]